MLDARLEIVNSPDFNNEATKKLSKSWPSVIWDVFSSVGSRIYNWAIDNPLLFIAILFTILATVFFLHIVIAGVAVTTSVTYFGWQAVAYAFANLLEPAVLTIAFLSGAILSLLIKFFTYLFSNSSPEKPNSSSEAIASSKQDPTDKLATLASQLKLSTAANTVCASTNSSTNSQTPNITLSPIQKLACKINGLLERLAEKIQTVKQANPNSYNKQTLEMFSSICAQKVNDEILTYDPLICLLWLNNVLIWHNTIYNDDSIFDISSSSENQPHPLQPILTFLGLVVQTEAHTQSEPQLTISQQDKNLVQTELEAYRIHINNCRNKLGNKQGEFNSKDMVDPNEIVNRQPITLPEKRTFLLTKLLDILLQACNCLTPQIPTAPIVIEKVYDFIRYMQDIQQQYAENHQSSDQIITKILATITENDDTGKNLMAAVVTPCVEFAKKHPMVLPQPSQETDTIDNTGSSHTTVTPTCS